MTNLDEKMSILAEQVLKRPLSDEERLEIYRISDAVGMRDVQSFLHLLLVFRLHEDSMKKQFDELVSFENRSNEKFEKITALEEKINDTLENSVQRVLGERAQKIGRDMGDYIAEGAKEVLEARDEYYFLRGQVRVICFSSILMTLAYWLGSANVLRAGGDTDALHVLLMLPSGWLAFVCCSLYTYMWVFDHWKKVKKSTYYKGILALQALILLALLSFMV
jgi:tetrahydromethanopterin S-methyltransferase subunit G